jgi:hypothetical protein
MAVEALHDVPGFGVEDQRLAILTRADYEVVAGTESDRVHAQRVYSTIPQHAASAHHAHAAVGESARSQTAVVTKCDGVIAAQRACAGDKRSAERSPLQLSICETHDDAPTVLRLADVDERLPRSRKER